VRLTFGPLPKENALCAFRLGKVHSTNLKAIGRVLRITLASLVNRSHLIFFIISTTVPALLLGAQPAQNIFSAGKRLTLLILFTIFFYLKLFSNQIVSNGSLVVVCQPLWAFA